MKKQLIVSLLTVMALFIGRPGWAQKGPIKLGFLTQMTGGGAAVGKDMSNGFLMYLEEIGSQLAGRKVEVIIEDTQGDPAAALTKLRKLAESDRSMPWPAFFSRMRATPWHQRWMSTRCPPFGP